MNTIRMSNKEQGTPIREAAAPSSLDTPYSVFCGFKPKVHL